MRPEEKNEDTATENRNAQILRCDFIWKLNKNLLGQVSQIDT